MSYVGDIEKKYFLYATSQGEFLLKAEKSEGANILEVFKRRNLSSENFIRKLCKKYELEEAKIKHIFGCIITKLEKGELLAPRPRPERVEVDRKKAITTLLREDLDDYIKATLDKVIVREDAVKQIAEKESGKKLTPSQVSRYWFRKGLKFIKNNFPDYLLLELKKLIKIFSGHDYSSMYHYKFEKQNFTPILNILFFNFYFVLPFALFGMILLLKDWKKYYPLYMMIFIIVFHMMIFFVVTRFRLTFIPVFIVFSVIGFLEFFKRIVKKQVAVKNKRKIYIIILGITTIVTLIVFISDYHKSSPDHVLHFLVGEHYFEKEQYKKASEAYQKSINIRKNYMMPVFGLSKILYQYGNMDMAVNLYNLAFTNIGKNYQAIILKDEDFDGVRSNIKNQVNK